ncbi:uncharacterized protein J8A68_005815 [[Candida] subhashii]|uniref:DUF1751-domain-containing protein n=1 Tax=[Candida] subhashii TaxID=561895 RepID=A0A8J5QG57_9ASCO|nr:uncharacterized protein J8A68_005815 [[Candida] subhashii]KAG7660698.1 hypothetical protein J8A68_005815 [[Candida] subhashii]
MKVPKVTSIILVILLTLTFLNFALKYYTYFVLMVSSTKKGTTSTSSVNEQQTGVEVPHPHELFVPLLTFIPSKSPVLLRPWVIITSSFIEEHFIGLFRSFLLIFYLGKYLENIWGAKEFTKFIMVNVIITNLILYGYYTGKSLLIDTSNNVPPVVISAMAINMGLFVAIKQRIPNHFFIFFKGNFRIKVRYVPFIAFVVSFILQLLSEQFYIEYLMSIIGFIISWSYLRFFKSGANERQSYILPYSLSNRNRSTRKKSPSISTSSPGPQIGSSSYSGHHSEYHPIITDATATLSSTPPITFQVVDTNNSAKGDRSEQFSIYTFFPYPISFIIKILSNIIVKSLIHYQLLDANTFDNTIDGDEDEDDPAYDDVSNLKTNLFGLSQLKGAAGEVSAIPHSNLKKIWNWVISKPNGVDMGIKTSMDKRRKLALKELE